MPLSRSTSLNALRAEYAAMFDAAAIRPERLASVDRVVNTLYANKARYEAVAAGTGVPWYVIAVLHSLEGGGSSGHFTKHLHNGDPLTARTTHVPANRPAAPPANGEAYTWEESALDAMRSRFTGWNDWSLAGTLWQLERYNGWRTRTLHGIPTPYLWSGTGLYDRGKYVADGVWNPTAVSQQVGAAALLKRMEQRGLIAIQR